MADQPKLLHAVGSLKFAAAAPLHAAAGRLFSLPYDLDTQIRLDLLIGDRSSRVTIASGDRHTSFVWLANGRVSVWDHVSKSHFTTAKAVPPMKMVRPPKLSIELMEDGDTTIAEVMIVDHALGRIRQRMIFTNRSDLQPYA